MSYKIITLLMLVAWQITPAGAEEVFIRASQVGYSTKEPKLAIAFSKDSSVL